MQEEGRIRFRKIRENLSIYCQQRSQLIGNKTIFQKGHDPLEKVQPVKRSQRKTIPEEWNTD